MQTDPSTAPLHSKPLVTQWWMHVMEACACGGSSIWAVSCVRREEPMRGAKFIVARKPQTEMRVGIPNEDPA